MKVALLTLVCLCVMASCVFAEPIVNLDVRDMTLKDAVAQITQQTGASIVLDPKAQGSVSISLSDAGLGKVLDVITKLNKLTWKKLQFAKPADSNVKLEQLKSAILALSSMPVIGLSVEDPASKTSAVFAKDLAASPDTTKISLPEGYTWATVYVILAPEAPKTEDADGEKDMVKALSEAEAKKALDMAKMTPEERQQVFASQWNAYMNLTPETRQAVMADQMKSMFNMDPQYRDQFREDMHQVFSNLRSSGEGPGFGMFGGPGGHGGDR